MSYSCPLMSYSLTSSLRFTSQAKPSIPIRITTLISLPLYIPLNVSITTYPYKIEPIPPSKFRGQGFQHSEVNRKRAMPIIVWHAQFKWLTFVCALKCGNICSYNKTTSRSSIVSKFWSMEPDTHFQNLCKNGCQRDMYTYINIYTHIYMHTYICMCTYINIHTYISCAI